MPVNSWEEKRNNKKGTKNPEVFFFFLRQFTILINQGKYKLESSLMDLWEISRVYLKRLAFESTVPSFRVCIIVP